MGKINLFPPNALTDIDFDTGTDAAVETPVVGVEGLGDVRPTDPNAEMAKPTACGCMGGSSPIPRKPLMVATTDKNGVRTTWVYAFNTVEKLGELLDVFESAKEGDVVHLHLAGFRTWGWAWEYSLMNSIVESKAFVHTYCSSSTDIREICVWLHGDEIHAGPMGWMRFGEPDIYGGWGPSTDVKVNEQQYIRERDALFNYCKTTGFITEEEIAVMIDKQRQLNLFGANLLERVERVRAFRKNMSAQN